MLMRRVSAKDKIPDGLVRAALVSGMASGWRRRHWVGSERPAERASASAASTSTGGDGCDSSFGNFALGLGPGTVAIAREGFINGAIAIGTNVGAIAGTGTGPLECLNVAFNLAAP